MLELSLIWCSGLVSPYTSPQRTGSPLTTIGPFKAGSKGPVHHDARTVRCTRERIFACASSAQGAHPPFLRGVEPCPFLRWTNKTLDWPFRSIHEVVERKNKLRLTHPKFSAPHVSCVCKPNRRQHPASVVTQALPCCTGTARGSHTPLTIGQSEP